MNGGILVNEDGERVGDKSAGSSEFTITVLKQPGGQAVQLFEERIFQKLQGEFDDFDEAVEHSTYHSANSVKALADRLKCDGERAADTVAVYKHAASAVETDEVGRIDGKYPLEAP